MNAPEVKAGVQWWRGVKRFGVVLSGIWVALAMSIAYPHFAPSKFRPVLVVEDGKTYSHEQLIEGSNRAQADGSTDSALRLRMEAAQLAVLRTQNIETVKFDLLIVFIPIGLFWALLLAGRWVFHGFRT